jgi:hypothetical protein
MKELILYLVGCTAAIIVVVLLFTWYAISVGGNI